MTAALVCPLHAIPIAAATVNFPEVLLFTGGGRTDIGVAHGTVKL